MTESTPRQRKYFGKGICHNPSVSFADNSLFTREPCVLILLAQTFGVHNNPSPSQKVLGIVKDLSQKVLDRGSGRCPAYSPYPPAYSKRN